jgi:nitroreductase / dihydropteridine reductase
MIGIMEFKEITEKRYSAKKFDGKKISQEKIDELFEMIRLSPSSANIQPWKVKVIEDQEIKDKLLESSYNQEQVTTCSHLLVFCATKDAVGFFDKLLADMKEAGTSEENLKNYEGMIRPFLEGMQERDRLNWAKMQTFIAMTNALNGATALGFDSCPMEGFLPDKYSEILEIEDSLVPIVVVPIGYAADTPREKLRFKKEDVFF